MSAYRIRNWQKFQHYNKPRPAWIKLHRTLLDDHDFHALYARSRATLVMLWLMAAESDDGTIPDAKTVAWRLRMKESEVSADIQALSNYLEPLYTDSRATLALDRDRDRDRDREETEREIEGEGAAAPTSRKSRHLDYVLLTDEQHASLVSQLNGKAESYIARLNDYIGSKGKQYRSHYHTILSWWRKDVEAGKVRPDSEDPF